MTLDEIDKTGLIRESYRIDGIRASECRSIFLDWALKLPAGYEPKKAIETLIAQYATNAPDHPMSVVLNEGLGTATLKGRRGGRASRVSS